MKCQIDREKERRGVERGHNTIDKLCLRLDTLTILSRIVICLFFVLHSIKFHPSNLRLMMHLMLSSLILRVRGQWRWTLIVSITIACDIISMAPINGMALLIFALITHVITRLKAFFRNFN